MSSSKVECEGSEVWEILAHLWALLQVILDEANPTLEQLGLTTKELFLLSTLEEHPFPGALARSMHLPPPTVSYLIKQLEAGGLLERRPEPGDLRKFRLVATETGREAITRGRAAMAEVLRTRLARLAPDEIGSFDRALERLARPGED
jgi:DNA-binding MarR family transcriptional regulator